MAAPDRSATPYNFHQLRGSGLNFALASIERGYAFVIQNERGKFHSRTV